MNYDITQYFINLMHESSSLDMAEAEFRRSLIGDEDMRTAYKEWCEEHGFSEKNGFSEFCEEYMENKNEMWDSLSDYDE